MIERLLHGVWYPTPIEKIRRGDVFRAVDDSRASSLMVADENATWRPGSATEEGHWVVTATPYVMA